MNSRNLAVLGVLMILLPAGVLVSFAAIGGQPEKVEFNGPVRMLVIAAHQDDGVIQAGGAAIKNRALGGSVKVLFLTKPQSAEEERVRIGEVFRAWGKLGLTRNDIEFLEFRSRAGEWSQETISMMKADIASIIRDYGPKRVYIPLRERGNREHDILNGIVRDVLSQVRGIELVQSSEYNPYYLAERHPGKVLNLILRLLPFVPYTDRTFGLAPPAQLAVLALSDAELALKRDMLLAFESQRNVIPLSQFGYSDLYDASTELPENVINLAGKYLSWPTLACLASIFAGLIAIGTALAYGSASPWATATISTVLLVVLVLVLLGARRIFMEELLFVVPLFAGLVAGLAGRVLVASRT